MFEALARLAVRRSRLVLLLTGVGILLAGFAGSHAFGKLKSAGFVSPHAPSQIVANELSAASAGSPDLIFLVQAHSGTVDAPAVVSAGRALTARLAAQPGVRDVASYWTTGNPALRSESGTEALVVATIPGTGNSVTDRVKAIAPHFVTRSGPITVSAGGNAYVFDRIGSQITGDLAKAESIAIPLTLLFLVLAFGTVVAATLPVVIGVVSIFTTLAVLWALGSVTSVSQYALNLTTAMSLGLAIDYSLLLVNRYREELASGQGTEAAITRAIARAGRTIVFSAATVAAAMAALLVFPVYFLRSMAYAGISVVVLATVGALVVLPAVLVVLGPRVNAWKVPRLGRRPPPTGESPFWRRVAQAVMRRPVLAGLPIVVLLAVLALPFAHVNFGSPDDRVLAPGSDARAVGDALRTQFPSNASTTTDIVTATPLSAEEAGSYSRTISLLPGVRMVTGPAGAWVNGRESGSAPVSRYQLPSGTWISALTPDPLSKQAQALVHTIRSLPVPGGVKSFVGGEAASLVDQKHDLGGQLPIALVLIGLTTFVVLWLFTGSVVLPLKALVLNGLTLCAVLGVMVWIFQYGHLSGLLDFTPLPTSTTMPPLLFCIAFGLSMDYEVFVLSRIKENHDGGSDNQAAVVGGLSRTGRIVTTAAALMAITFFSFAISKVSFIQMFALGTGIAVLVDATLVRGVLVPAFMRLAGDWNWWSPPGLRRLYRRFGISEAPAPAEAAGELYPSAVGSSVLP
jgi:putative drug exporter of the RND superfamily